MNCFDMKRRDFITLLAATAAMAAPRRLRAQPQRIATIGVLVTGNASPDEFLTGLREALREVGLTEGPECAARSPNRQGQSRASS